MPEIANFLASKCVEQDPRCDYAECRVPKPKLLRICIFDLQSTAKLSFVCLFPFLCLAVCLLGCLFLSFSFAFRSICHFCGCWNSLWILNLTIRNTIANKNATIERNQLLYTPRAKWNSAKHIIAFSLTQGEPKARNIYPDTMYNDDYL